MKTIPRPEQTAMDGDYDGVPEPINPDLKEGSQPRRPDMSKIWTNDDKKLDLHFTIETLIDQHGLNLFLSDLVDVCAEKAEHIIQTYGDEDLAEEWKATARQVNKIGRITAFGKRR